MRSKMHVTGSRHVVARSAAWAGVVLAAAALVACGGDDGNTPSSPSGSGSQPLTPVGSGNGSAPSNPLTPLGPSNPPVGLGSGGSSSGATQTGFVTCQDYDFHDIQIAPKTVTIFNNAGRTIYPVLTTSTNGNNQWIQGCNRWPLDTTIPTHLVYKLYVNQGAGIPDGSSITITLPLYSQLPQGSEDKYITWWNGTRVNLADNNTRLLDTETTDANAKDTPLSTPASVTCVGQGTSCQLTTYSSKSQLPVNIYAQLSEFTFGDFIGAPPDQSRPLLNPDNVGYNISYVDHVYLPVAIEPAHNPYIGYSGSAMDIHDFDTAINNFLLTNGIDNGWSVYNLAGPRRKVPGGYNIFAERRGTEKPAANMPVQPVPSDPNSLPNPYTLTTMTCIKEAANGTQCSNAEQAEPYGAAVQKMQDLWGYCVNWNSDTTWKDFVSNPTADPETACKAMGTSPAMQKDLQLVHDFFAANYETYEAAFGGTECRPLPGPGHDKVPFDFFQTLKHVYGWVPFNDECNNAAFNALANTKVAFEGKTWTHAEIQPLYINDLQYNYRESGNTDPIFNPYVKLIHEDLQMNAYGFSVDDSVGFMSELGSGLIFAVGSANGLSNPGQFSYAGGFTLDLGNPTSVPFNKPVIKSYGVCVYPDKSVDKNECRSIKQNMTMPTDTKILGFRIGTVSGYPLRVSFTDVDNNVYSFDVVEPFGEPGTPNDPDDNPPTNFQPKNIAQLRKGMEDDCTITNANQPPDGTVVNDWCHGFVPNVAAGGGVTQDPQTLKNHIGAQMPIGFQR